MPSLDALAGDTCLWCGKPLPDERRADQVYCNHRCQSRHYWTFEAEAIRDGKRGRICAVCQKPMPVEMQASAIYCSEVCRREARRRRALPPGRTCARCSKPILVSKRQDAIYCSDWCRTAGRRALPEKPCGWCGTPFTPQKARTTYCCRSCAARARIKSAF
jgi:predicted nucleic acid-binding Zn ribbon protein